MYGYEQFRQESGFSPAEQEVIFLTISRENDCTYCMAAHSFVADNMSGVPMTEIDTLRNGTELLDPKLRALSRFTQIMVETRGLPSAVDVEAFLQAGYSEQKILEVIVGIAVKTISNYSNHLFHTDVDDAFSGRAWQK